MRLNGTSRPDVIGVAKCSNEEGGVMLKYSALLLDSIEREKAGIEYRCPEKDKEPLVDLLCEINHYAGTDLHYLAELDAFYIQGAGKIVAKYIERFSSESVKGFLIPHLVSDKVQGCDMLILQLYLHFRSSDEYIAAPGSPAPAHIYVSYDNAFRKLRPKRLSKELIALAYSPRDAFYLPFTMRMLASWKLPEMKNLLISYATSDSITAQDVGICDDGKAYFPPLNFIKRELKFTAIEGLKNYPSEETINVIASLATSVDDDIKAAAKKTLKALTK